MKMTLHVWVSALALVAAETVPADVVYRETFANGTVGNQLPSGWGWSTQSTSALSQATRVSGGPTAGVVGGVYPTDVNSNSRVGQNIGGSTASLANGFMAWTMTGGGPAVFAYTNEYSIDRSVWNLTGLSLDANVYPGTGYSTAETDLVRLALQIGGTWYVTAQAQAPKLQSAGGGTLFASEYGALNYGFLTAADAWRTLTISGSGTSSGFTIDSAPLPADLPGGTITGLGVYWDMAPVNGGTISQPHWDNLTVLGVVPEPAGLGLSLLASAILLRRRARRAGKEATHVADKMLGEG
jgi:hypothetical protein